jgi:chemotaxis protein methyltransferase CheR
MTDAECTTFLQWALPRLQMRWAGFRKVRGQVCNRLSRRISMLGLEGMEAYRAHLTAHPDEWDHLDSCCRVTISRFYRDRGIFDCLRATLLPDLAREALRADGELRVWSAGCASGEEPYSLILLWQLAVGAHFPEVRLLVEATEADTGLLERARAGIYPASSLKDLPEEWVAEGFEPTGGRFRLRDRFRTDVRFSNQDIRRQMPGGPFGLILCRNLVFTYYEDAFQVSLLERMLDRLKKEGALVLGAHERLPEDSGLLEQAHPALPIFRRPTKGAAPVSLSD